MKKASFWSDSRVKTVIFSVIFAAIAAIVMLIILLVWLRKYTEHGIEVVVPNMTGMYFSEAQPVAEANNLNIQVIDSTFSNKVPLGTIVEQNPPAGSHAKHGRPIYVIINASFKPRVPLPELHDISYRQAQATLKTIGIEVEEIVYEPSEYKDLVLDIRQEERSIETGERMEEGSKVILVVGRGKGTEQTAIPDLRGKSIAEARQTLLSTYLTLGAYEYDAEVTENNTDSFIVYSQSPQAGTMVLEGTRVDIKLSTDLEKAITSDNTSSEEDFF